ncbi:MAG: hypothetical protein ACOX27_00365 [Caldicoprobacterales bacterium]|jgi:hypothetical protein|nr:hypothetical protein [Clostridiales bacterium]
MFQIILYVIVGMIAAVLATLVVNRNKTYHGFMIHQCNMNEEEYDRIYNTAG